MSSVHRQGDKSIRDLLDWLSLAFGFQVMSLFIHLFSDMFKEGGTVSLLQSYWFPCIIFGKHRSMRTEWCAFCVQKSNVENQRENMVLLLANISTRTAAQERHPLVRYMPF
jgi:callose synthase